MTRCKIIVLAEKFIAAPVTHHLVFRAARAMTSSATPLCASRAVSGASASTSFARARSLRPRRAARIRASASAADDASDAADADDVGVRVGGSHFDRLVERQAGKYASPLREDETSAALDAFWASRGVREQAYRARLVNMGTSLASNVAERDLYRNPDRIGHSLDRLQRLFPKVNVADMMWKEPEVLRLTLRDAAAQMTALRFALPPDADLPKLVSAQPGLLLADVRAVGDALKALAEEFPRVDVGKVVQTEPSLLTESCDVLGRLKRLRRVVETRGGVPPPSMAIFYDGGPGCSNPTLFAKVFLEETRGDGEAYESDTRGDEAPRVSARRARV